MNGDTMKNAPPAFQFYASDYLSSSKVQRMTLEAQGAYIRLLAYSWLDGHISTDIGQLARLCGVSRKKMAHLWDNYLRDCFRPTENDPNKLVNERLESVRSKLAEFKAERSTSGRLGAERRWRKHGPANDSANDSAVDEANGSGIEQPIAQNSSSSSSSSPPYSPPKGDDR